MVNDDLKKFETIKIMKHICRDFYYVCPFYLWFKIIKTYIFIAVLLFLYSGFLVLPYKLTIKIVCLLLVNIFIKFQIELYLCLV